MKARAGPRVCRTAYFAYCRIGEVASSLTAGSLGALCNYPLASPEARILPKMATWHIRESPTIVHLAEAQLPSLDNLQARKGNQTTQNMEIMTKMQGGE